VREAACGGKVEGLVLIREEAVRAGGMWAGRGAAAAAGVARMLGDAAGVAWESVAKQAAARDSPAAAAAASTWVGKTARAAAGDEEEAALRPAARVTAVADGGAVAAAREAAAWVAAAARGQVVAASLRTVQSRSASRTSC